MASDDDKIETFHILIREIYRKPAPRRNWFWLEGNWWCLHHIHIVHHFRFEIQIIIICIVSDWCFCECFYAVVDAFSLVTVVFYSGFLFDIRYVCVCICRTRHFPYHSFVRLAQWMHTTPLVVNDEWLKSKAWTTETKLLEAHHFR